MAVQTFEKNDAIDANLPTAEAFPEQTTSSETPRRFDDLNEFDYHPVPVLAVVGLVLAVVSSAGLFIWMALPLSVLAFLLSGLGLWIIRRSAGAYGGTGVALAGLFLSFVFLAGGIGFQVYTYQTEVPKGYERISFVRDISDKRMRMEDGKISPPPEVAAFDGKKVFLKGYIYQTKQTTDLHSFLFVKDNASCCFGANPELWDRLGVVMNGDKTINYHAGKVAVAGTFRINPKFDPNGELEPIYIIDADKFTTRVSDF
ncbi:hypothetical protein SH661x_001405 [Planctomicrobium sp. SH661]|uniref:hypothetical protein n=1 Tax=Planctomicrobium sp. SH661 TaxID=3448124 RepID=UPI003F5C64B6